MITSGGSRRLLWALLLVPAVSGGLSAGTGAPPEARWPGFRGISAAGIGDGLNVPPGWSAADEAQWKTAIPGLGHSSPIVWDDRVYVTTAVPASGTATYAHGMADTTAPAGDRTEQSWHVLAIDRLTGRILWDRVAKRTTPAFDRHPKATHANATPATDGRFVAALFGSEGLFVYAKDGTLAWSATLGELDGGWSSAPGASWGFGSSPAIHDGVLVVQCDTQSQSFVAAFDVASGRPIWKVARHEDSVWASPVIVQDGSESIVLVSGTKLHRAYALSDGRELWSLADGADVKVPTPIAAGGLFLFGGGSTLMKRTFYAVRAGARGAIEPGGAGLAWSNDASPHVPTPLAYRGLLYVLGDSGIFTTYDLATGRRMTRCRFPAGDYWASPLASDGRIYVTQEEGTVIAAAAGGGCTAESISTVGEAVVATPAMAPSQLIVRGQLHVFAFAHPK